MKFLGKTAVTCVALILLVTFTVTACSHPLMGRLPAEAESFVIEPGKGTPRFFLIDADNNPVTADTPKDVADPGRTLVYVDDNPGAQGVYVTADSTGTANDLVSIIETNRGIRIDFFYRKGEQFPHAIDFWQGDTLYSARLSAYDMESSTYSMTTKADGEYESFSNLILNRCLFEAVNAPDFADPNLHDAQNARMRQIYITLGLYTSLSQMNGVTNVVTKNFLLGLAIFFAFPAVMCFAMAFIVAAPVLLTIAAVGLGLAAACLVVDFTITLVDKIITSIKTIERPAGGEDIPAGEQPPSVIITVNGVQIPEDTNHVYSFNSAGETVTFDLTFINYDEAGEPKIFLYNPVNKLWYKTNDEGATHFFEVHNGADIRLTGTLDTPPGPLPIARPSDQFKVQRNSNSGMVYGGLLDLVLYLGGEQFIINGNPRPITFYMPNGTNTASEQHTNVRNMYVLHLKNNTSL
jgi:hypothetical protein